MPYAPKRPCRYPGCAKVCDTGVYCEEHRRLFTRESAAARGYGSQWQTARSRFLKQNPLCVQCRIDGKLTPATVVDHVVPHRGDKTLFWDQSNWQPLCATCHNKKTGSGL